MNFQTLNKQRKFILIAAAAGIIAVFLPWVTVSAFGMSESMNGFHGWGVFVFLLFIVTGIVSIMGDQLKPLEKNMWFLVLGCGAVIVLSILIALTSSGGTGMGMSILDAGVGIGLWIDAAAGIGVILFAWLFKNPADTLKGGFDDLKKSISIPSTTITPNKTGDAPANTSNKIAELERLTKLKESGSITEEEFQQLKSKLM